MSSTITLRREDLNQFTGSENWYKHALVPDVLYTDGARYVAQNGGAYWLLDEIALAQRHTKTVTREEFQLWKLTVNADQTATLACEDGNGSTVWSKHIEFTDFPLPEIILYCANNTIHLPSEN